jgi:hypothetical protein
MNKSFTPFVATVTHAHTATETSSANAVASPAQVTLKRDGDRVTHILVECSCGEVIELACAYDLPV